MEKDKDKKKKLNMWHPQHEAILKGWGESCACYRYLHYKAYQKYKKSTMRYTLPIIIISTITGTANFAQDTFPETWRGYVPAAIGGLNLFGAILTTVSQFLKVNELMESHRVSSIHYGKLSRSIRLELNLPKYERTHDGANMVDICRTEYDRLIEQSPPVPGDVLRLFERKFNKQGVTKPDITTISPIDPFNTQEEEELSRDVVNTFKQNITHITKPVKSGGITDVVQELKELRTKNLVSRGKDEEFQECELVIDIPESPNNKQE